MSTGYDSEFATVELIRNSTSETRGVDAFCLAWIKYERQARKLCSFLLFRASDLQTADAQKIRGALFSKLSITHTHFRGAIQSLSGLKLKDEFGNRYSVLNHQLEQAFKARNKIFHGQQTGQRYSREQLFEFVDYIKEWCRLLADLAAKRFDYDGFTGRNSLVKAKDPEITAAVDKVLQKIGWEKFIQTRL